MTWRAQGITGSNNIPLGSRRRFGGADSTPPIDDGYNPTHNVGNGSDSYKRGRSQEKGKHLNHSMFTTANRQQLKQLTVVRKDARSETVGVMLLKIRLLA